MSIRPSTKKPGGARELSAQATRSAILRAAIKIFSEHGYDGGRVEHISKAANSHDRMIYYYFGSKEGLYVAVLEYIYQHMHAEEAKLILKPGDPVASLKTVISFLWNYYQERPEFIALLNTENLHKGKHIQLSEKIKKLTSPTTELLVMILSSGIDQNLFRKDITGMDVYLMIAALAYFYLSNRHTLSVFLNEPLGSDAKMAHWEAFITEAVLRMVLPKHENNNVTN